MFSAFFVAFFVAGLMFKNSNPINAFLIYKNLSNYQPATFTAMRVIEVIRSRNGNSWVGDRQLLGTVQYAFARADAGFMVGRHIEYVYKISSYNTPELGQIVIAKPVSVLFNQTIQTDAMGESLAVIGADPAEHVKMFWFTVVKALFICLGSYFVFTCGKLILFGMMPFAGAN